MVSENNFVAARWFWRSRNGGLIAESPVASTSLPECEADAARAGFSAGFNKRARWRVACPLVAPRPMLRRC